MLASGEKMMAYPFVGYWKDVGTISSLWEANMDLLGEPPVLNLNDEEWRVYARHEAHAPQFVGESAVIVNSSITEGCDISGTVINSIVGAGVKIKKGATVRDSVLFEDVVVESGAQIDHAIIDSGTTIGSNSKIGKQGAGAGAIAVVAADLCVPADSVIPEGAMISKASDINKEVK
jgi:glucose-1-phosphate adenylyltransferase